MLACSMTGRQRAWSSAMSLRKSSGDPLIGVKLITASLRRISGSARAAPSPVEASHDRVRCPGCCDKSNPGFRLGGRKTCFGDCRNAGQLLVTRAPGHHQRLKASCLDLRSDDGRSVDEYLHIAADHAGYSFRSRHVGNQLNLDLRRASKQMGKHVGGEPTAGVPTNTAPGLAFAKAMNSANCWQERPDWLLSPWRR